MVSLEQGLTGTAIREEEIRCICRMVHLDHSGTGVSPCETNHLLLPRASLRRKHHRQYWRQLAPVAMPSTTLKTQKASDAWVSRSAATRQRLWLPSAYRGRFFFRDDVGDRPAWSAGCRRRGTDLASVGLSGGSPIGQRRFTVGRATTRVRAGTGVREREVALKSAWITQPSRNNCCAIRDNQSNDSLVLSKASDRSRFR